MNMISNIIYYNMKKLLLLVAMILTGASYVHADEGMWLPSEILKKIKDIQSQGFKLSAEDIYSVNKSSLKDAVVRFALSSTTMFPAIATTTYTA